LYRSAIPLKPDARLNLAPQFAGLPQQPAPQAPPPEGQRRRGGPGGPGGPGGRGGGGFGEGGPPKNPFQFALTAIDRTTGKTTWQKILREETPHEGHHPQDGTFASSSPIADASSVFGYFGSRGLYALDHKGNVRWQKDLGKMQTKMSFGEGSSPALFGNTLVVNWDHEGEDFIAAFDKNTGNELWKQKRNESTSWGTPLIVQHAGSAQVIVNASDKARSYDLATGKELWSVGPLTPNSIPSPVAGNGMVYCMSGFRGNALFAVKLGRTGELTGTDAIAWTYNKSTPYVPSPLLYGDRLYFFASNNGILTVLDANTGKPVIDAERLTEVQNIYASPVGAADRIYIVGRDGSALVLKKGDKVEVLATNKLDDRFDASPAVVGRELFLRGKQNLYCITPTERAAAK
jgi:outer membrane protein assembly factor BamB